MTKKVFIVHTSLVSHKDLNALFHEIMPDVKVHNIVDDSLLEEVKTVGHITPNIVSRMVEYFKNAEKCGANLIFNQCSSVGEAAEIAAKSVNVPVLRIDQAMAEKAISLGQRIAVVGTVASTMEPSCQLIEKEAHKQQKQVEIIPCLIDGVLDILMKKGPEEHNQYILEKLEQIQEQVDVIVLAQGSMAVLEPQLTLIRNPVLTSPRLGVEKAKVLLNL
ncbi:aspartate/glutamate racemase family protein [Pasteurella bettyae]|uniref:aspartate/glutamate racemase family protein n=1 Tax=Pasteurella bettyae TaxID=752 RepID=UPI003D270DC5